VAAVSILHTKASSLARYIGSHSGIINVTHERGSGRISMGRTPYRMLITTARSNNKAMENINSLRGTLKGWFVVKSYGAERTEDFIVSMTLETFAPLLEAHYNTVVLPRLQEGEKG
jgi:hypothetical protein